MFDGIGYLKGIATACKACQGYKVDECSGPMGVEGAMHGFRKSDAFVLVDDTTTGSVSMNRAGGAFDRRIFTVFLLKKHKFDDMGDYEEKMKELRSIYRLFLSRIVRDRSELELRDVYVQASQINYHEPGPQWFNGVASIYFMLSIDEPIDLSYDDEQWSD